MANIFSRIFGGGGKPPAPPSPPADSKPLPEGLAALLGAPPSEEAGQALIDWVKDLSGRIQRGDMMIGILTKDEVELAPRALRRAIECGVEKAWLLLADWQAAPPHGEADVPAALDTLRAAMRAGVLEAGLRLAEIQWFARRDEASAQEAGEAWQLVKDLHTAEPGHGRALHQLGLMTCQGFGTAANPALAAEMQGQAAALGYAPAAFEAYIHYETALGVTQDSSRALAYLEQAGNGGHPRALYNLGALYATGKGVVRDMGTAAQWYEKAADAGNPRAMATLGAMYATGDGVEEDMEHARQLFDEAEYLGFDTSAIKGSLGIED